MPRTLRRAPGVEPQHREVGQGRQPPGRLAQHVAVHHAAVGGQRVQADQGGHRGRSAGSASSPTRRRPSAVCSSMSSRRAGRIELARIGGLTGSVSPAAAVGGGRGDGVRRSRGGGGPTRAGQRGPGAAGVAVSGVPGSARPARPVPGPPAPGVPVPPVGQVAPSRRPARPPRAPPGPELLVAAGTTVRLDAAARQCRGPASAPRPRRTSSRAAPARRPGRLGVASSRRTVATGLTFQGTTAVAGRREARLRGGGGGGGEV